MAAANALLIGEVCVDLTLPTETSPTKMRLGGIVHAARALWAAGIEYAVAAYCPRYLTEQLEKYLKAHGCHELILLGEIVGAPNVIVIRDVREVGDQGYEDILREEKSSVAFSDHKPLDTFKNVVVFPGSFDLMEVLGKLSDDAKVTIDVAYDVDSLDTFAAHSPELHALVISTSSALFLNIAKNTIEPLVQMARGVGAKFLLLKENRGGSRLFDLNAGVVEEVPAVLTRTTNSVGVGDAYTAIFGTAGLRPIDDAWRGMQVATVYSQTTFVDDLRRDVTREFQLPISTVQQLGGVQLPWHDRSRFEIYLAAPDFSYVDKREVDAAVAALRYHNFTVRRPIQENGEAKIGSAPTALRSLYDSDIELLRKCAAVFAVPLGRDPGTLVEIGLAIEMHKPVITYDPRSENNNTMVISGSVSYSSDLDDCLNAVFTTLADLRRREK